MDHTVSAIIPLYNGKLFICDALNSVLRQSRSVNEIVVVDDGSEDGGADYIGSTFPSDKITILKKENGGQSSARNFGGRHACGKLLAFLDQDDIWSENHIKDLLHIFEQTGTSNVAVSYGNVDRIDETGRFLEKKFLNRFPAKHPKHSIEECLRNDMFIVPSASVVTKESFLNVGGFDDRLSGYEDDDLFLRIFLAGYDFSYADTSVTKWRIYGGSTSHSSNMARSRMIYFKKLVEMFPNQPLLNAYWTRDLIAPRFLEALLGQMFIAANIGNLDAMKGFWRDATTVMEHFDPWDLRQLTWDRFVMEALLATGQTNSARSWLRKFSCLLRK